MVTTDRVKILRDLMSVAKADGVVTEDEMAVIRQMDMGLERYESLLAKATSDNVIDFDEFMMLRRERKELFSSVLEIALSDDRITKDERELLVKILELTPSLAN